MSFPSFSQHSRRSSSFNVLYELQWFIFVSSILFPVLSSSFVLMYLTQGLHFPPLMFRLILSLALIHLFLIPSTRYVVLAPYMTITIVIKPPLPTTFILNLSFISLVVYLVQFTLTHSLAAMRKFIENKGIFLISHAYQNWYFFCVFCVCGGWFELVVMVRA